MKAVCAGLVLENDPLIIQIVNLKWDMLKMICNWNFEVGKEILQVIAEFHPNAKLLFLKMSKIITNKWHKYGLDCA